VHGLPELHHSCLPSAPPIILPAAIIAAPAEVARLIIDRQLVFGLVAMELVSNCRRAVVYRLRLDPWRAMADEGFPQETLGILVTSRGDAYAVPQGADERSWKHRYGSPFLGPWLPSCPPRLGQLCLWHPGDSRGLRWEAADGLVAFITIAHRHLLAEELYRRTDHWYGAEAPHGGYP
jgi:hypothetical protein